MDVSALAGFPAHACGTLTFDAPSSIAKRGLSRPESASMFVAKFAP